MHLCHASTRQAIIGAHAIYRTWRKTAKGIGYSPNFATVLCQIADGKPGAISAEREDDLRIKIGFLPIYGIRVAPCPTCGDAHVVADCHGKPGTPVIQSAPLHPVRQRQHRVRREMTAAQATVWDNLSKEEKDEMLGVT